MCQGSLGEGRVIDCHRASGRGMVTTILPSGLLYMALR